MIRKISFILIIHLVIAIPAGAQTIVQPDARVVRSVNVRSGPDTATSTIGSLRPGEQLQQVGEVPNWYEVQFPDGRKGFVSKAWTLPVDGESGEYRIHTIDVATGLAIFV